MKINPRQRWLILGSLLIATLAAGLLAEDEPPPPSRGKTAKAAKAAGSSGSHGGEGRQTAGREKAPALAAAPLTFPEPQRHGEGGQGEPDEPAAETIDPFRSKSWYVAPPPPPPPKPSAPPLPFQYLGKLNEAGEIRVFLNHQGKHLIVRTGDVLNGTYSVEEIAGSRMSFLYLPLKETQVLAIGEDK